MSDLLKNILNSLGKFEGVEANLGTSINLQSFVPYGVPTRIPSLDLAIRRPGLPCGRIVELFGLPSSGKSSIGYSVLAQAQRMGGLSILIETERAFDALRAKQFGINLSALGLVEVDTIETVFTTIQTVVDEVEAESQTGPTVIVVDSITGVESELNRSKDITEESRVGEDARVIRKAIRKLADRVAKKNILLIFVNHAISKIGNSFGKQTTSSGGNAIKFWSSIRLELANVSNVFDGSGDKRTRKGMVTNIRVEKNKVAATGTIDFKVKLLNTGFDIENDLLDAMVKIEAVERENKLKYRYVPEDILFSRNEWPSLIDKLGGWDKVYSWFLKAAMKHDYMLPYGEGTKE